VDTQSCLSVGSVFANRACLVLSVGSVIAGPLVVGPSVELLCCSTSGSWDSNTVVGDLYSCPPGLMSPSRFANNNLYRNTPHIT
jgi:hypothetical protein